MASQVWVEGGKGRRREVADFTLAGRGVPPFIPHNFSKTAGSYYTPCIPIHSGQLYIPSPADILVPARHSVL